jgi:hypothetical protein
VADGSFFEDDGLVGVGVSAKGRLSLACTVEVGSASENIVEVNVAVNVAVKAVVGVNAAVFVLVGVEVVKTNKAS